MSAQLQYAGFWKRFAALFVDVLILLIPQALFGYLVGIAFVNRMTSTDPVQNYIGFEIWSRGIALGIAWLYFSLLESSKHQATIGKMALGLVVTDLAGNRISFARATGRFFGKILSSIIMGIGYLLVAFTPRKQALHDLIAQCLVLSSKVPAGITSMSPNTPDQPNHLSTPQNTVSLLQSLRSFKVTAPLFSSARRTMLTFITTALLSVLMASVAVSYAYNHVYYTTICLGSGQEFGMMFDLNGAAAWYGSVYKARFRNNTLMIWNDKSSDTPDVVLSGVSNLQIHKKHPTCEGWPKQRVIYVASYENQLREEGLRLEKEFGQLLKSGWSSGRDIVRLDNWLTGIRCYSDKLAAMQRVFGKLSLCYD